MQSTRNKISSDDNRGKVENRFIVYGIWWIPLEIKNRIDVTSYGTLHHWSEIPTSKKLSRMSLNAI